MRRPREYRQHASSSSPRPAASSPRARSPAASSPRSAQATPSSTPSRSDASVVASTTPPRSGETLPPTVTFFFPPPPACRRKLWRALAMAPPPRLGPAHRRQAPKSPSRRPHRLASLPPPNPFSSESAGVGEEGHGTGHQSPRRRRLLYQRGLALAGTDKWDAGVRARVCPSAPTGVHAKRADPARAYVSISVLI